MLVVSFDSDLPCIDLNKHDLRNRQILHRFSNQFMCAAKLMDELNVLEINSSLTAQCFVIGWCDFNSLLKKITQSNFVPVSVNHGAWLSSLHGVLDSSLSANNVKISVFLHEISIFLTTLLISIAF